MSRFRHSSSFAITLLVYAVLIGLYISLLNADKPVSKAKESVVKIALLTPPAPKKTVKPIVVPPKPKPKPKKIVKKVEPKPKPKPPKIVKKIIPKPEPIIEPIVEEVHEEEIYKEPIKEEVYREPEVYQAPIANIPPAPQVDLESKKRDFLDVVRATIHTNKKYPKMAKRRNIQGTVHVVFDIQSDGTATNIQTSGGASVLQKAVRKSIERSFPLSIPSELMGKFPMMGVSVNVDFVLE